MESQQIHSIGAEVIASPVLGWALTKGLMPGRHPHVVAPRQGQWEPCLLSTSRIKLCFSVMFNTVG